MNVALSTSVIQRGRSGVGQYVLALVRALLDDTTLRHRFHLHLLVLEEDLPLFDFARGRATLVPVHERHRPAVRNILWHQITLPRLARKASWDLIHIPSYRRLLARAPCPTLGTVHDLAPFHVSGKYDPLRMLYGRLVVRQLAHRQRRLIAVSQNTAHDLQTFFHLPAPRIRVIHNGLDHRRFHPGDPAAARQRAKDDFGLDAPFFLFVSRLEHPGKNHLRLIEAFGHFKAATGSPGLLALAGADWRGTDIIRAAAQQSPVSSDIRFLGFVPEPQLPDVYRAASALVYPSLFEGFGMPPLEAMACGCPVASSTRGALAEVVADAAETFDPESVPELTETLLRIQSDASLRDRRIQAGLQRAAQFTWEACATETARVWTEAAAPPPSP